VPGRLAPIAAACESGAVCGGEGVVVAFSAQHHSGGVRQNEHRPAAAERGPRLRHHRAARFEQFAIASAVRQRRFGAAHRCTWQMRIDTVAKTALPGFLDHRTNAARYAVVAPLEARQRRSDGGALVREGAGMPDKHCG